MIRPARALPLRRGSRGLVRLQALLATALVASTVLAAPVEDRAALEPTAGAPTAAKAARSPLRVTIESISPSTVPRRGPVTVTGRIRNASRSTWRDLNAYLFASALRMTTRAELEEANATPETLPVGARITSPGHYVEVGDLAPGETTSYRLSVPRRVLPFADRGVYWLGVHVLGTDDEGRTPGADGRARTFIASMAPRGPRAAVSLVVPLRSPVRRTAEGRLADIPAWERRIGDGGRLDRLLDVVTTGQDVPLSWVVDPAVLQAVRSLAAGDPSFDLTPTDGPDGQSESPGGVVTESPGVPEADTPDDPQEELTELSPESELAADWLERFLSVAAGHTVLALPYGDLDVAAVLRHGSPATLERASILSLATMEELGLPAEPVVAPPDGLLPSGAVERLDPDSTLLLSERAVTGSATALDLRTGPDAVLANEVARTGGPSPSPRFAALALRQRILAEAAVHALARPRGGPLVVPLPESWNPGPDWPSAAFFPGLQVPWMRTIGLPLATALGGTDAYDGRLAYPRAARRRELPAQNVRATRELYSAGSVLAALLNRNDTIDTQVGRAAMLGSSVHARRKPHRAVLRTSRISGQVHELLEGVYVEGSPLVTMSSESGNFSVTVVNGLEEPVTVGIKADTGTEELVIRGPDQVSLGPGQRASVRLAVTATDIGVHSVQIFPTTSDGRPLGRSTRIKVRSSQVGLFIWVVMGTGAAVFVVALVTRVVRRVRRRSPDDGPRADLTPAGDGEP